MRTPVASGFYPFEKNALQQIVRDLLRSKESIEAVGAIVPHAGYLYSGRVAGKVYASIKTTCNTFFIFAPNHTGVGSDIAVSVEEWKTPLGIVKVNKGIIDKLKLDIDENAHAYEHAIEVQLPFLQVKFRNFKIVPIVLKHVELKILEKIAQNIYKNAFFIASSDFIHYGPMYGYMPAGIDGLEWVKSVDKQLINLIINLDYKKFYATVLEHGYTVCGFVPITLLLIIMKKMRVSAKLIDYTTSYDISPNTSFVTYAGIIFYKS